MSLTNQNSVLSYIGNGSTVTPYSVSFPFLVPTDVKVTVVNSAFVDGEELPPIDLAEGTDYTLIVFTNAANEVIGGQITTVEPWGGQFTVYIYRNVALTQLTVLPEFGPFPANALELSLDKIMMALQQQERALKRCFRVASFAPQMGEVYPQRSSVIGVVGDGQLGFYTGAALLALLELPGTLVDKPTAYWLTDLDREFKRPDLVGQFGLQRDGASIWYSYGTNQGQWRRLILSDADLASETQPPTAARVKLYVDEQSTEKADAAEVAAKTYADGLFAGILSSPTGQVSPFAFDAAPTGWVLASGRSIGNASSNGTERANVDCHDLFVGLWNDWAALPIYPSDSVSPTSRGASAEADWAANKRLSLPDLRGRVAAGKDNMGGDAASRLTNTGTGNPGVEGFTLGATGGVEKHQLTVPQLPSHNHSFPTWNTDNPTSDAVRSGGGSLVNTGVTATAGSNQAHPNVQPTIVLNYIIKL
jgi:microcystin-dependent protein